MVTALVTTAAFLGIGLIASSFISGEAPKAEMALILFLVLALVVVAAAVAYLWYLPKSPKGPQ